MDEKNISTVETADYIAPALADLGEATTVTLGNASFDKPDDTQYYE